jgi:hypothetical protein
LAWAYLITFAPFKRIVTVILPIQFEQVEGIQENLVVMGIGMEFVEVGLPILPTPDCFPVHDDGLDPKGQEGFDNEGVSVGPVVTPARE